MQQFASAIHAVPVRFSEAPDILRDSVHLGRTSRRTELGETLYADDAGIVSEVGGRKGLRR